MISEKKGTARFIINVFCLEDSTEIDQSISKKQNNGRAYEVKIEDKEHHFDYCYEFGKNTKCCFVRIYFNQLSKFKILPIKIKNFPISKARVWLVNTTSFNCKGMLDSDCLISKKIKLSP